MKKLIATLALLAACHSTSTTTTVAPTVLTGNQSGATDALSAVKGFMAAAKQQDLQIIGGLWGDAEGPARERFPRQELEQRELIMMRCLRHDRFDIVGDAPNPGGARAIVVSLTLGDLTRSSNFEVVRAITNRWYVKAFDMAALQDICSHRAS
ncbi:MAG: hypothetical protein ABJF01_16115 [bacterium]